jgi:hypothetical protein
MLGLYSTTLFAHIYETVCAFMMSSFELVFISFSALRISYGAFHRHVFFVRDFRKYLNNLFWMLLNSTFFAFGVVLDSLFAQ